ncbi:UNKNOWN [Stylonychia lemnae]|uniref:Casein kinase i n=1 Tax=Stylonychia lemnae TaxID=5949 RepID=A0A078BBX7_STYLE|nr:UNKNOWN [Stylonychia lemnae]|eukprot:CDW90757.1 UNKNOWN [Stylonychia lemnae]
MVLSRHGYDLHTIHKICGFKFTYKTILNIGIEMLDRVEKVHQFCFIYNNFTPHNILIPLLSDIDQGTLYMVDFRKCRKFDESPTFQNEIIQAKLDDLESLFFMLCYLVKGQLPWSKPGQTGQEIFKKEARSKIRVQQLQDYFIDMDEDFIKFFRQLKHLERVYKNKQQNDDQRSLKYFAEDPFNNNQQLTKIDYSKFRTILFEALYKHQSDKPYRFDWYPVLTKIQRHNRKQGQTNNLNNSVQSAKGRSNSNSKPVNKTASLIYQRYASASFKKGNPSQNEDGIESESSYRIQSNSQQNIKPEDHQNSLQIRKMNPNLLYPSEQFKQLFDGLIPDDIKQEQMQQQQQFLNVKSSKFKQQTQPRSLRLKRERSRSVKYDDENEQYKPLIDNLDDIFSDLDKKQDDYMRIRTKQEQPHLFHSPSFSQSDMDQFSADIASPALIGEKKSFMLGELLRPATQQNDPDQQSASISRDDNQAGDSSIQEAGEESKEEIVKSQLDFSAIYSSEDDFQLKFEQNKNKNQKQRKVSQFGDPNRKNKISLEEEESKSLNFMQQNLQNIINQQDLQYEECNSYTIDQCSIGEFDEGLSQDDCIIPHLETKSNVKWMKRQEESKQSQVSSLNAIQPCKQQPQFKESSFSFKGKFNNSIMKK